MLLECIEFGFNFVHVGFNFIKGFFNWVHGVLNFVACGDYKDCYVGSDIVLNGQINRGKWATMGF